MSKLVYYSKGEEWHEALPIGNGHIGAMIFGDSNHEKIHISELTLWSGKKYNFVRENANEMFQKAREACLNKNYELADELSQKFTGIRDDFGTNIPFGYINIDTNNIAAENYQRSLDINNGIVQVADNNFISNAFISNDPNVLVYKYQFKNSTDAKISFTKEIENLICTYEHDEITIKGYAYEDMHSDGHCGVAVSGVIKLVTDGKINTQVNAIEIENCKNLEIYFSITTNYALADFERQCKINIQRALEMGYEEIINNHIQDFSELMNRVQLSLGNSEVSEIDIEDIMAKIKRGEAIPEFDAIAFQFGRYILASCSRSNSILPSHLQGIWNDNKACKMSWTCDYHLDINQQMNYWAYDVTNLSECITPLKKWIENTLIPGGEIAAKDIYGVNGWTAHVIANAWGFAGPGDVGWGVWSMGGIFITTVLWEHYLFNEDIDYLNEIFPIIEGAAIFAAEHCININGELLTGPSQSPENRYIYNGKDYAQTMGNTSDIVCVREILNIALKVMEKLKIETNRELFESTLSMLPKFKIGEKGNLQEWYDDYEEADPYHRHISHMLSLFPYNQLDSKELKDAAKKTLELKMTPSEDNYEVANWAQGLLVLDFARFKDGNSAHHHLQKTYRKIMKNNLMVTHPAESDNIYEVDGNTGICAGVAEMLIQSHDGFIELMPAIPKAWDSGKIIGLKARGGFIVSYEWKDERLIYAEIENLLGNEVKVKLNKTYLIKHDNIVENSEYFVLSNSQKNKIIKLEFQ